jgi:hypothetical protein
MCKRCRLIEKMQAELDGSIPPFLRREQAAERVGGQQ